MYRNNNQYPTCYNKSLNISGEVMKVDLKNALGLLFSDNRHSLESVYFEAITNSLDANASKIKIDIVIDNIEKIPETLSIRISDNGTGFNDKSFARFCTLLSPVDEQHKGIGRLIYLEYFNKIDVESHCGNQLRKFTFDSNFTGENAIVSDVEPSEFSTSLYFHKYVKSRVAAYEFLNPKDIQQSLIHHFLPMLYEYKASKQPLEIEISLSVPNGPTKHGLVNDIQKITPNDVPELESREFFVQLNNFLPDVTGNTEDKFLLRYSVTQNSSNKSTLNSMIASDNRTIKTSLVNPDYLPNGFQFIIVIESDYFKGRADSARVKINYANYADENIIKSAILKNLKYIVYSKFEFVKNEYEREKLILEEKFPHLKGLLNLDSIELNRDKVLNEAQSQFFETQKKLLLIEGQEDLSSSEFQTALDVSSRLLMEYILYRNFTINRLKEINCNDDEEVIHNIILPIREKFKKEDFEDNIFRNNAWLLDDKFMTFSVALSDKRIHHLYNELDPSNTEVAKEPQRPDIAIVFNKDPDTLKENEKVDVVIIELKKLGLKFYDNKQVIDDLKDRARRLLGHYDHKIQRVWFYGITEIPLEFEHYLREQAYIPIFSSGKSYYKEEPIMPEIGNFDYKVPMQIFIMSLDTFIKDAKSRNQTFLDVLKLGIEKSLKSTNNMNN